MNYTQEHPIVINVYDKIFQKKKYIYQSLINTNCNFNSGPKRTELKQLVAEVNDMNLFRGKRRIAEVNGI